MRTVVLFIIICLAWGCQSKQKRQEIKLPDINPETIGNMRMAILGKARRNNLLLVNQSNKAHLYPKSFARNKKRNSLKMTELEYYAKDLPFDKTTAIVYIEDEVMAKLVALYKQYHVGKYSKPITAKDISNSNWPEQGALFFDYNGQTSIFLKPSNKGPNNIAQNYKAYRTMKYYIIQAQATGYRPLQILRNTDGSTWFQQQQRNLKNNKNSTK